jgi:hypothetical protein
MKRRVRLQIAPIFGACFVLHERDILLEWQGLAGEPLDGKLLDPRGLMPDVKLLLLRIHQTGHTLACQCSTKVVLLMIDDHAPISLHGAGKGLLLHPLQEADPDPSSLAPLAGPGSPGKPHQVVGCHTNAPGWVARGWNETETSR